MAGIFCVAVVDSETFLDLSGSFLSVFIVFCQLSVVVSCYTSNLSAFQHTLYCTVLYCCNVVLMCRVIMQQRL